MKDKKAIALFLVITGILSGLSYYLRFSANIYNAGWTSALMWCPGIAAIIVSLVFYSKDFLDTLGLKNCSMNYILLGFLIPVIYFGLSYGLLWILFPDTFLGVIYNMPIVYALSGLPIAIAKALGEEIGWRGFLQVKLDPLIGRKKSILICGLIWGVWHYPMIIAGKYLSKVPLLYALVLFTVVLTLMTAILSYLRIKSNSVWPAAVFHGVHNYVEGYLFLKLTTGEKSPYLAGEAGIFTVIALLLIIIIFALLRKAPKTKKP